MAQTDGVLQKLRTGYTHLLGAPPAAFEKSGFTLVSNPIRNEPEWANWIQPIWFFSIGPSVICSVAPQFADQVGSEFKDIAPGTLLEKALLRRAELIIPDKEWVQCELFYYPLPKLPTLPISQRYHNVVRLELGQTDAQRLLRNFDGGVYAIRDSAGKLASHAAIKNKGVIREIAVGTQPSYQRQGMGREVVTRAVQEILSVGCVPTYWPDSLDNTASYALARTVGFIKVAQMLFCAYERPGWSGFVVSTHDQI
ncbi:MAG: GNAT family N-acetyltransferase [Caldilineaceae bacterium]|nr:GNAT family N-acetyltransferase [Caldilineaceae bacterium]